MNADEPLMAAKPATLNDENPSHASRNRGNFATRGGI